MQLFFPTVPQRWKPNSLSGDNIVGPARVGNRHVGVVVSWLTSFICLKHRGLYCLSLYSGVFWNASCIFYTYICQRTHPNHQPASLGTDTIIYFKCKNEPAFWFVMKPQHLGESPAQYIYSTLAYLWYWLNESLIVSPFIGWPITAEGA